MYSRVSLFSKVSFSSSSSCFLSMHFFSTKVDRGRGEKKIRRLFFLLVVDWLAARDRLKATTDRRCFFSSSFRSFFLSFFLSFFFPLGVGEKERERERASGLSQLQWGTYFLSFARSVFHSLLQQWMGLASFFLSLLNCSFVRTVLLACKHNVCRSRDGRSFVRR